MSPEQWLQQVGSEYLAKVQAEEPQFLIEIDVPDDRLEEIFNNISNARQIRWTNEQRLCLALAAVYSAAHADEGEGSFRQVFYRRLRRPLNQDEWENYYGPYIATFLKDWFSVELPESGPYRYVSPIYQHAGIPVPARSSFCQLLGYLWKGGVAFTRNQYAEAVRKVSSTVARPFLKSQAGYDFAQTTARFIARWERGQISAQELATFPSYRHSLYKAVLSEMQRTFSGQRTVFSGSYPPPILVLDSDTRRLVVKFDAKGVAANVYRTNSGPVYCPTEPVSGSAPVQYSIRPETQRISVSPWWVPDGTTSALFRTSDGALVDTSRDVQAGTYYFVTSRSSSALQQLTFAVIPRGIDIHVLEACCSIDEPAHLQVRLPAGWQFEPKTQLQDIHSELWQISAGDRVVDATLSCGDLKFPISLRIPRVALWFNVGRGDRSVLWREDLSHDLPVDVEGLPNTQCSILLESDGSTRTVCELGILPASGTQRISLGHFRDALATCGFSVAEFLLRMGEHPLISTGRYFASGDAIARSLSEEPVDSILFRLPSIGDVLLRMRRLFDEAPESILLSATRDVPHSLRSFLCGLACAAAEIDASALSGLKIRVGVPSLFCQTAGNMEDRRGTRSMSSG